jgi:hypothetical protein
MTTPPLYHERQAFGRQLCACHALNNLLRAPQFSAADLFRVAASLGGGGVAQTTRFFGNFDVNAVQVAAGEVGVELDYFDAREAGGPALDALLLREGEGGGESGGGDRTSENAIVGLLLNVPSRGWWAHLRGSRHWLAIVPVGEVWYNLDSKLAAPAPFADAGAAAAFLRASLVVAEGGGGTLLVARRKPPPGAAAHAAEEAAAAAAGLGG